MIDWGTEAEKTAIHGAPTAPGNDHYFPYFFFKMSTGKENTSGNPFLWLGYVLVTYRVMKGAKPFICGGCSACFASFCVRCRGSG